MILSSTHHMVIKEKTLHSYRFSLLIILDGNIVLHPHIFIAVRIV